jgi:Methyltransferase domain
MPTLEENLGMWSNYDWSQGGNEWSSCWGDTETLWWGSLFPRIRGFFPAQTILEIAPGYGRFTDYLRFMCGHLNIVDLTPGCIEACQKRFKDQSNISYFLNDGKSLSMIADNSIDLVLEAYMLQLSKKLKSDGVGFFHHSNVGEFVDPSTGETTFENIHWRAKSVTAQKFVAACEAAGIQCISQEIVNWGGEHLCDCISVFTLKTSRWARPNQVIRNDQFMAEATHLATIKQMYVQRKNQNQAHIPFNQQSSQVKAADGRNRDLQNRIEAMESSKFWQLRKVWFKFKRGVGLKGEE